MTDDDNLHASVASFLGRHGWRSGPPGVMGSIWTNPEAVGSYEIAVPTTISPRSRELELIAATLSSLMQSAPDAILHAIEGEFLDFSLLRIDDTHLISDTAPLQGSASVLSNAYGIYRAVATTQRRPRAYIGSAYSTRGDAVAVRARLGHTRVGSFVLPVALPVEPIPATPDAIEGSELDLVPETRELSRSVASALGVLEALSDGPDAALRPEETQSLVASGVSYEVVRAVKSIIEDPRVGIFETSFEWAGALRPPKSVPKRVEIPASTRPRLERIASTLRSTRREQERTFSGPIVDIFHRDGDETGTIKVESSPNGRRADVEITIGANLIREALLWKRDHLQLLVVGKVVTIPGKGLAVPKPSRVEPLEELFKAGRTDS